ncbi:hypothetical protein OG563_26810 [Nocardia vinacea]|uniref:Uncharacterized protein n=1 Tax=Nocardia vinacea TaxID=96468 RepID=A0ABZ1YIJ3_9NOCA|nr:hypothetical protein [Nocardia vinacea]
MQFEVGQLVRIGQHGISVFRVVEVEDDRASIEPTIETALNRYPVSYPISDLMPHDGATETGD